MPQPPAPLPLPPEKPGKLEGISKKLIPFALILFILSLGYYFSVFFINREIKVKIIKSNERNTGETSAHAAASPILSGLSGDSSPLPGSTPKATASSQPQVRNTSVKGETSPTPAPSPSPVPFHKKINLNTAKADDFTNLPGLGVKKSLAIIEYRRNNGPFKTTEDIMKVKGIGKKLYEKIRPWIYVK